MPDYAIIANGNFLVEEILVEAVKGKIIIALDGAADKLARLGLNPHLILGDFDSISEPRASKEPLLHFPLKLNLISETTVFSLFRQKTRN